MASIGLRSLVTLAVALWLVPCSLRAQAVRGVVLDSASRQPVPDAAVLLLSVHDSIVGRTHTDADGHFEFEPAASGSATRVRVQKIAFVARTLTLTVDAANGRAEILLSRLPASLDTVLVTASAGCHPGDNAPSTLTVWRDMRDEVRAGLDRPNEAADPAHGTNVVTNARWYYDYRIDSLRDTAQLVAFQAARTALERFLRGPDAAGGATTSVTQAAASEDLLFGDAFIAHHCLRLVRGTRNHAGEVAVEFEPARGDETSMAIAGHWWISAPGGALRALEFRYVHSHVPEVAAAHGWLEYAVDDGIARDADWWMYDEPAPRVAAEWRAGRRGAGDGHASSWSEWTSMTESIASPPSIRGIVRSKATGAPVAGVRVRLYQLADDGAATGHNAAAIAVVATDAAGVFRFTNLADHHYMIRATDSTHTGSDAASFDGETTFALLTHSDWLELENYDGVPFHRGDQPRDAQSWGDQVHPYPPDRARRLTIELGTPAQRP